MLIEGNPEQTIEEAIAASEEAEARVTTAAPSLFGGTLRSYRLTLEEIGILDEVDRLILRIDRLPSLRPEDIGNLKSILLMCSDHVSVRPGLRHRDDDLAEQAKWKKEAAEQQAARKANAAK